MRNTILRLALGASLAFGAVVPFAAGQMPDCEAVVTQADLTACAAAAYERADAALNEAYDIAVAEAARMDAAAEGQAGAVEEALRRSQRLWLQFRDAACEVEALPHAGGSIHPMVRFACLERQTRQRSNDLKIFSEEG